MVCCRPRPLATTFTALWEPYCKATQVTVYHRRWTLLLGWPCWLLVAVWSDSILKQAPCCLQLPQHQPSHRRAKLVTPLPSQTRSRCPLPMATQCRQHMPLPRPYSREIPSPATTLPHQPTFPLCPMPLQSQALRQLLRPSMQPSPWAGELLSNGLVH